MAESEANWEPLRRLLGLDCHPGPCDSDHTCEADGWMWVYGREYGSTVIQGYKHKDTRKYLFLDADANAYLLGNGEYTRVDDPQIMLQLTSRRFRA